MKAASFVFVLVSFVLCCSLAGSAQDPTKVAPDTYKLQFENDWIRILSVRYAPHAKVPVHNHSQFPAAYIYLSDSGPINFVHSGWDDPLLTRPATKAGSFRLSPTRFEDETHAVENRGDLASEFLRIEIKTEAPNRASLSGRFTAYAGDRNTGLTKVEFENTQLKVTRLIAKQSEPLTVAAADEPSLIVVVNGNAEFKKGQTFWISPGDNKSFASAKTNARQIELLRLDFKTKPKKP
jgi:hypothetical protein